MPQQFQGTLFHDSSEGDYGKEALLDIEMSWILRICSNADERRLRPNLYYQCRYILNTLLGWQDTKNCMDYPVENVLVWRQWSHIDVCAEIIIDGKLHVLVLEDKAYTAMTNTQRDSYPEQIRQAYQNREAVFHFCVISLFDNEEEEFSNLKQFVKGSVWEDNVFSAESLPDWTAPNYTESDIFNEFWFARW